MAKKETWMPTTAGILDIVAGSFVLLGGITLLIFGTIGSSIIPYFVPQVPPVMAAVIFSSIAVPLILIAILAIVGGVYALQRKIWGLALAGSIAAFFSPAWVLGVAAIVLRALAYTRGIDPTMVIPETLILSIAVIFAIFAVIADILAIVGGIYALQKKKWGLALAGSIAAFFASLILGTAAIVFTVMSKNEFE